MRELRNAVQRMWVMAAGDTIDAEWLPAARAAVPLQPASVPAPAPAQVLPIEGMLHIAIGARLADVEREVILATFAHCGQHKERTAATLGISMKTLYNRLKEYQP